jgi:hypothetical protein
MLEEQITAKRTVFGRVQVTIPMQVKNTMLVWMRKSGMGKAEFLRVSLMIGAKQLAESVNAIEPGEGYYLKESEQQGKSITGGPA